MICNTCIKERVCKYKDSVKEIGEIVAGQVLKVNVSCSERVKDYKVNQLPPEPVTEKREPTLVIDDESIKKIENLFKAGEGLGTIKKSVAYGKDIIEAICDKLKEKHGAKNNHELRKILYWDVISEEVRASVEEAAKRGDSMNDLCESIHIPNQHMLKILKIYGYSGWTEFAEAMK